MMTEGKSIPRLQITAQGRLADEAIIQLVKNSKSQVIKFQDLREFVAGETHSPVLC